MASVNFSEQKFAALENAPAMHNVFHFAFV